MKTIFKNVFGSYVYLVSYQPQNIYQYLKQSLAIFFLSMIYLVGFIFYFQSRGLGHPTMKQSQIAGIFAEGTGKRTQGLEYGSYTHWQQPGNQP